MRKAPTIITSVVVVLLLIGLGIYLLNRSQPAPAPTSTPVTMPDMNQQNQGQNQNKSTEETSGNEIDIKNFAFSPASLTVKKGTTVKWTNYDDVGHNIVETDDKTGPSSPTLAKNQTYSFTYNDTGTFSYKCSIHPKMTGTVTVTE